jgi:hypothetical protein
MRSCGSCLAAEIVEVHYSCHGVCYDEIYHEYVLVCAISLPVSILQGLVVRAREITAWILVCEVNGKSTVVGITGNELGDLWKRE